MKNTGKYQSHEVLRNQQPVVVLTPTCRRVKVFVLIPLFCSCDLILALWPCWYSRVFLQDLEGCLEAPEGVGACFLERVRRYKCWSCVAFFIFIHLYVVVSTFFEQISLPCVHRKRVSKCTSVTVRISHDLRRCGDSSQTVPSFRSVLAVISVSLCSFVWLISVFRWSLTNIASIVVLFVFLVKECQKKLEHKLGLDSYLLKPIQRLTKYQLLLKVRLTLSQTGQSPAVRYASWTGYVVLYFQWDWT